jgi:very-short-patch-repair endonuclease
LETRYLRQVERAHGLPPAIRQIRVRSATGTTYDDARYPEFGVVVELDGRRHTEPQTKRRDAARDNEHTLRGLVVLRYDWMAVAFDACRVAHEVGRLLRSRGWSGAPRWCDRCGPDA